MNDIRYSTIVEVYDKLESTTKRLEMTTLLVELLNRTPKEIINLVIYLTQGKLYPDFKGVEIGIAEKLAIKSVSIVTGITEARIEEALRDLGDLGTVAEKYLQTKTQQSLFHQPLSVNKVYKTFEKIAKTTGPGSVDIKIKHLTRLLNDSTPTEARYLIRTALGKLRLGIADMTMLDALAESYAKGKSNRKIVERAYNISSDLGLVAKLCAYEGLDGIRTIKVKVGNPIRPMLAERLSNARTILDKLNGIGAAEYKYDGIRIQAHINSKTISLFSRRLENVTSQFPDICHNLRANITASEVIVEGECVAIIPETGEMQPFQMISQRRGRKHNLQKMSEQIPIKIYLFDLLYLNGVDYTSIEYPKRRKILESIIIPSDKVELSRQIITRDINELNQFMDQAVSEGCEGLIVKSIKDNSLYTAGARGWQWIKYKRSYKSEVVDTFDLVIIGAFKGRGKRTGFYGTLLMAAYNQEEDLFETICKLASGFTDNDLINFPTFLDSFKIEKRHIRVKSLIDPDVHFIPKFILEVAADEITLSPLHTCARNVTKQESGLALRFPRFTGNYRKDKNPEDATTSHEIIELYNQQLKHIG